MTWLTLLRAALDERHEEHQDDPCFCYETLCDGLRGVYRFPPMIHGPAEPARLGCLTPFEAAHAAITAGLQAALFRYHEASVWPSCLDTRGRDA